MPQDDAGKNEMTVRNKTAPLATQCRATPPLPSGATWTDEAPQSFLFRTAKLFQDTSSRVVASRGPNNFWTAAADGNASRVAPAGVHEEPPSSRVFSLAKNLLSGRIPGIAGAVTDNDRGNALSSDRDKCPSDVPKQSLWTWISGSGASLVVRQAARNPDDDSPLTISPPPRPQGIVQGATVRTLENKVVRLPSLSINQGSSDSCECAESTRSLVKSQPSTSPRGLRSGISKREAIAHLCNLCDSSQPHDLPQEYTEQSFRFDSLETFRSEELSNPKFRVKPIVRSILLIAFGNQQKWFTRDTVMVMDAIQSSPSSDKTYQILCIVVFLGLVLSFGRTGNADFVKTTAEHLLQELGENFSNLSQPPRLQSELMPVIKEYCLYLRDKCIILQRHRHAMDGNFSVNRFLAASVIESIDGNREQDNNNTLQHLFHSETVSNLASLHAQQLRLLETLHVVLVNDLKADSQHLSYSSEKISHPANDVAVPAAVNVKGETTDVLIFAIAIDCFYVSQALQYFSAMIDSRDYADLNLAAKAVFSVKHTAQNRSMMRELEAIKTALSKTTFTDFLLTRSFVVDEVTSQAMLDLTRLGQGICRVKMDNQEQSTLDTLIEPNMHEYCPQSSGEQGTGCRFSSFGAMHAAFSASIRETKCSYSPAINEVPDEKECEISST